MRKVASILAMSAIMAGQVYASEQTFVLPPAPSDPQMEELAQREFELSAEEVLPLTPEQIKQFKQRMTKTTEAMRQTAPPSMATRTERLRLEPGVVPPLVTLVPGYVSTLVFYDASGAPWPITSITPGNTQMFSVQHSEDLEPGNMVTVSPLARHAHTNLAITLAGQSLPVIIQVRTDDRETGSTHDSLVSYQATMRGPLADDPIVGGTNKAQSVVDATMLSFLDGAPPADAQHLSLDPQIDGISLWQYEGQIYMRTQHSAVWPAWSGVVNGTGKTRVYRLPLVPSVMVSVAGATHTLSIGEL